MHHCPAFPPVFACFLLSVLTQACGSDGPSSHEALDGDPEQHCEDVSSTETRPQLTRAEADDYVVEKYLAQGGSLSGLTVDNWDPSADLRATSEIEPDFTVAANGSGTHTTVQSAISAATGAERKYILIKPGTYRETVSIASTAPPLTLYGLDKDPSQVVIVDNKSADSSGGTSNSATFTARSRGFQVLNLTISNDFDTPASGSGLQAVALHTQGDQTILKNVHLHGFQDTLYLDSSSAAQVARVYIENSVIEGDTDFIFGRATAVIEKSTIVYLASRKGTNSSTIMAPSTHVDQKYGFLVTNSEFTAEENAANDRIYLGRSWDTSSTTPTPNGQALVRGSLLGPHVRTVDPWAAAATSGREFSVEGNRFAEYCNRTE